MLLTDIRTACRSLLHNRSFTIIAILTLALGIGMTTAIFSVVNAVLLRPLPYRAPDRLVWVSTTMPALNAEIVGGADYLAWRDESRSLSALAAYDEQVPLTRLTPAGPERLAGARVSARFLGTLGVQVARGRAFARADERLNAPPVAIVSARLWQRVAGSSLATELPSGSIGSTPGRVLTLESGTVEIVGVLPASFAFPGEPRVDVLLPLRLDEATERSRAQMSLVRTIGRLADGVDLEQARDELTAISRRSERAANADDPDHAPDSHEAASTAAPAPSDTPPPAASARQLRVPPGAKQDSPPPGGGGSGRIQIRRGGTGPGPRMPEPAVVVRTLQDQLVGDVKPALMLLAATVVLVLLIACANVANLLLARAAARTRELAVRVAIGASRWRIVRQLLVESIVLSLAGGLAAVVVAYWTLRGLAAWLPPDLAAGALRDAAPRLDVSLFAVALIVSAATALVFGVVPARWPRCRHCRARAPRYPPSG